MLAAYHGHASVVSLLIRQGADPNQLNDRGQSPLAGAIFKKEDEVVEVSPCVGMSLFSSLYPDLSRDEATGLVNTQGRCANQRHAASHKCRPARRGCDGVGSPGCSRLQ